MRVSIYLFLCQFIIIYDQGNLIEAKSMFGPDVRSVDTNEFPFVVGILKYFAQNILPRSFKCTGSLISKNDVLTSEHCLDGERLVAIKVVVGSSNIREGVIYYPEWWLSYDQWTVSNGRPVGNRVNDIGILNLLDRVPNEIEPAQLLSSSLAFFYGMRLESAGWGILENGSMPMILQTSGVNILAQHECESRATRLLRQVITVDEKTICSIGNPHVILTPGDSGGPLFFMNFIIGINHGTFPISFHVYDTRKINLHLFVHYYNDFITDLKDLY